LLLQSKRRVQHFREKQASQRNLFFLLISAALMVANTVDRRIWKLERSAHWWEHIVKETFSDHDWMENFRMNRTTFDYLCTKLATVIERQRTRESA